MMICSKLHCMRDEVLLAACDETLLGKVIEDGDMKIEISQKFYGERIVDTETFIKQLSSATSANLIGEKVIELAMKAGFIDTDGVMKVCGVSHAQIYKMV